MKKNTITCFLLFYFTQINIVFAGGGWINKKNHGYFKIEQRAIINANSFYNENGERVSITGSSIYFSNLYAEYGITNNIDIIATVPFFVRSVQNSVNHLNSGVTKEGDQLNYIGDLLLGAKYGFLQKGSVVLSGSMFLGIPTGKVNGGKTEVLQTGDGEFNFMPRLDVGISLYPLPAYINIGTAINLRTRGFSNELYANFEFGWTFKEKLLLSAKIWLLKSFYNGTGPSAQNGIFSNNIEYLAIGPQVTYFINKNWGISGSIDGAAYGKNILASPTYAIGCFYRM